MGLREVPKWEFWIVERRALRDGERTSKMKIIKGKRENLLGHFTEDPGGRNHPHDKEIFLGYLCKKHTYCISPVCQDLEMERCVKH